MNNAQWINTSEPYDVTTSDVTSKQIQVPVGKVSFDLRSYQNIVRLRVCDRLDRKTILISDLGDPRVFLVHALPLFLETIDNQVTAFSYDLDEFGVGANEDEALHDVKADIVDLYFLLKGEHDKLGPLPQRHWDYLKSIVQET